MKRLLLLGLLGGCSLYFGNNNDPPPVCNGQPGGGAIAATNQRDPLTGLCSEVTYPGGTCGDPCAPTPCAGADVPAMQPMPECDGPCAGLDEQTCLATPSCHAAYDAKDNIQAFDSCWDIAPFAPSEGGDCTQNGAYSCALHDDCVSVMVPGPDGTPSFASCQAEGVTTACNIDCPVGSHCEHMCTPCDPGPNGMCTSSCSATCVADQACANVDCGPGYTCEDTCDAAGNCFPTCVAVTPPDPGSCTGAINCNSAPPACPANTVPGIANGCYTGFCIPKTQCGGDPGTCDGNGVMCNIAPPQCPMGTVPGVLNGCWSGYCIPTTSCPTQLCSAITDEKTCLSRPDCQAVYTGNDCTCYPDGTCTCASETFSHCQ
jgi:hypothetical protein